MRWLVPCLATCLLGIGTPGAASAAPHAVLPVLPTGFGPLQLGQPAPTPECASAETLESGTHTCYTRDRALLDAIEPLLERHLPAAQLHSRDGILTGFTLSVAGCSTVGASPNTDPLLARFALPPTSRRSSDRSVMVARVDTEGTVVSVHNDDDHWCSLHISRTSEPVTTDAPFSDGVLEGVPWDLVERTVLGLPIDTPQGPVESALLHPDGVVAVVYATHAEPRQLVLQAMTPREGAWRPSGDPVPVPSGSSFGQAPPPEAQLYAIGTHWLLIESNQRICQSGADPCHTHKGGHLFHLGDDGWRAVGPVPVDITGSYGHLTCELQHIGFDRAVVSVTPDTLRLRITPARTRALCDANTPGCTPGPEQRLHHPHHVYAHVVADARGVRIERPDALSIARDLCAQPPNLAMAHTLAALWEMPSPPASGRPSTPQARGWACLLNDETPHAEPEAFQALGRTCIEGAPLGAADKARLLERFDTDDP